MFVHRRHTLFNTLILSITLLLACTAARSEERCETPAASLKSANGSVLWRSSSAADWAKAQPNQIFCTGDSIRVESQRAALRLANNTVVRLKEKTLITLLPEEKSFWLELKHGAAHFLTRTPKQFTVKAPYLNAAVDGTEFVVSAATTQNEVLVFEGQVTTSNNLGTLILTDGMRAFSNSSSAPQLGTKIRLQDSVEWVLYYPALYIETPTSGKISTFVEQQQYQQALEALQSSNGSGPNSDVLQASLALTIGQNTRAKNLLENTLVRNPSDADARALQVLMLLVEGHGQQAITESKRLIEEHPNKISAQHAQSYALQSQGEIESALVLAEQAYKASDNSPYAAGRYAELSLSTGKTRSAKKILQRALEVYPHNSRLNALAGFVELNQLASKQALTFFNKAVEYNSEDSLSYLGQALALIQQGKLEQGRQQMELAVLLDPSSSLLRSYLGKTYFEGSHNDWSATQYQLAKTLDPNDPTPWFYEAHLRMEQNRLPEALSLITTAIEKNDNRAVYRSRLLLDSDTAARSANQAGIYQQLGFDELAKNTAVMAVRDSPNDFATHQALTLAYSKDPKAHHARADEALLTKLYQPIGAKALNVGVGTVGIQALPWLSPSEIGLNEYSSLFTEKGLSGNLSMFEGTQDSKGHQMQAQLTGRRIRFDAGQYKYQTDGFRDNNSLDEEVSEIGAHYQALDSVKLFAQHSKREHSSGDLTHGVASGTFNNSLLNQNTWSTSEIGATIKLNATNNLIIHLARSKERVRSTYQDTAFIPLRLIVDTQTTSSDTQHELAHMFQSSVLSTQVGLQKTSSDNTIQVSIDPDFGSSNSPIKNLYSQNKLYAHINSAERFSIRATLGAAHIKQTVSNALQKSQGSYNEYRVGLHWSPISILSLETARWKTISNQNTLFGKIEQSHLLRSYIKPINGFMADNLNKVSRASINLKKISLSLSSMRSKNKELIGLEPQDLYSYTAYPFQNKSRKVDFAYNANRFLSLTASVRKEDSRRTYQNSKNPTKLNSTSKKFDAKLYLGSKIALCVGLERIRQLERYGDGTTEENDHLTLLNIEAIIKLPKRYGELKLTAHNLTGEKLSLFQGQPQAENDITNPVKAILPSDKSAAAILTISF